jgi:hypothetical protein
VHVRGVPDAAAAEWRMNALLTLEDKTPSLTMYVTAIQ